MIASCEEVIIRSALYKPASFIAASSFAKCSFIVPYIFLLFATKLHFCLGILNKEAYKC